MAENKKKKERSEATLVAVKWAVPVVLCAIALFITFCFISQDQTAHLGHIVSGTLLGLFSSGAYMIPALLIIQAIFFASDLDKKRLIPRIILSVFLLASTSMLIHTIWFWQLPEFKMDAAVFYADGTSGIGGGIVGGALATVLRFGGRPAIVISFATVVLLYAVFFITKSKNPVSVVFRAVLYSFVKVAAKIEKRIKKKFAENQAARKIRAEEKKRTVENKKHRKIEKKAEALMEKEADLYDDEFFEVDNGLKEFKIADLGIKETRSDADLEMNPSFQDKVFHPSRVEDDIGSHKVNNRKLFNAGYDMDHKEDTYTPLSRQQRKANYQTLQDDSADSIFSEDFDEFGCEANTRFASMQSTAPEEFETVAPRFERRTFSENDIAAARKRADFNYSKPEYKVNSAYTQTPAQPKQKFEPSSFEFDINPEKAPVIETYTETQAESREYSNTTYSEAKVPSDAHTYKRAAEYATLLNNQAAEREAEEKRAAEKLAAEKAAREAQREAEERAMAIRKAELEREALEKAAEAERMAREATKINTAVYDEPSLDLPITDTKSDEDDDFDAGFDFETDDADGIFTGDEDEPTINVASILNQNTDDEDEEDEDEFTFNADDEEDLPEEKQNPVISEYQKMFSIFEEKKEEDDEYAAGATFDQEDDEADHSDKRPLFTYGEDIDDIDTAPVQPRDEVPFEFDKITEEDADMEDHFIKEEVQKPDYSSFEFPPIDILKKGFEEEDPTIAEEIAENGEKLIDALAQFDVRASIKSVDRGPRITRYEIVPARGVRVSKVIGLFDDIALNLAAEGIRMEAPIPGKSAIGVEIPNKHPSTVFLRDLLESDEFVNESSKTFACFGKDVTGNPVFGDIAKMPHMLVAGATGMGKSVCINSILISILYKARPDEVKFIMIDPKTVEFTMYNGIPHLLVPVVTDAKQAAGALMWAIDEMNRRYELMAKHEVRKLDSYNDIVRENPSLGEVLPKIIIVIDELNDLMQQVRRPVEGLITNITQKARAAGIHMIIGTQRPSVDVITGVIKANVPSRVSCKVTSFTDSKTILDQAGAEKLLDKGDMLFAPVGKPKPIRVQGAFVADSEVEKIMKFLKSNVKGNIYDERALEDMIRAAQKCNKGKDSVDGIDEDEKSEEGVGYLNDKQFLEAVDLAIKQGKISTSLIQRKISVGYGKAAKFIDIMEEMGLVSEPNGSKPRDVLVTRDEWHEMLSRRSLDD